MKWKQKQKSMNYWKKYFTFLPRKVGDYWIWFEYYDATDWEVVSSGGDIDRKERYPSQL